MEETREIVEAFERHEAQVPEQVLGPRFTLRRSLVASGVILSLVLLVLVPPLLNVNRYARRIALSIGASLGRPVHLDTVTLNLLPLPGFTLRNFVVSEDPAFGAEPVIRANSVRATLRIRSLWRRRVEFSTISLTEPSVNVVHLPDGRWNLESILLQASRMPVIPTGQKAGEVQRFPYIEATGARVNLKLGGEKTPFSLTEAEFALWLSDSEHWRVRLEAHPTRTDTAVSDSGLLRLHGTLGRASSLASVPIDMEAEWRAVPLGSLSLIALKKDVALRGAMTVSAKVRGVLGTNEAESLLQLTELRRADFVPVQTAEVVLTCALQTSNVFLSIKQFHCVMPVKVGKQNEEGPAEVTVAGSLADLRDPATIEGQMTVRQVPSSSVLDLWRVASDRVPDDLSVGGIVSATLTRTNKLMSGELIVSKATLNRGKQSLFEGQVKMHLADNTASVDPQPISLGADRPASLSGRLTQNGAFFQLRGMATRSGLLAFTEAIPQLGDGVNAVLPAPGPAVLMSATAVRTWGGGQVWTQDTPSRVRIRGGAGPSPKRR